MSNRRVAPSTGANDDNFNPRRSDEQVTQEEIAGGIIMMGHYEDAQLSPNNHGNTNNNPTFPAERANPATNANLNIDPPQVRAQSTCSICFTPGHRWPDCPQIPCKYCGVMGHLDFDCPAKGVRHNQRRQAQSARKRAMNNQK